MNTKINRAATNHKSTRKTRRALWLAAVLGVGLLHPGQASAATYTWASGDTTGNWNSTSTTTDWSSATFPHLAGDIAQYLSTTANGTVSLNVSQTIGQVQANDSGRLFTISAGGGTLTFDNSTNTVANIFGNNNAAISVASGVTGTLVLTVAAPISLTNSDLDIGTLSTTAGVTVSGAITATTAQNLNIRENGGTGAMTLSGTIGASGSAISINNVGTSTGTTTISGIVGPNASITENSSTSTLFLSGANTFTGGLTIKAGTVSGTTNATAFGAGAITLGDSSGIAAATLLGDGRTFANPIVLGGSTGTLTIGASTTTAAVFSGGVTGTSNL
ncbi:MAG: hypothetical protein ABSH20_18830, partial [Tepidisphaeraceae bacterium]